MRSRFFVFFFFVLSMASTTFAQRVYTSSGRPAKAAKNRNATNDAKGFDPDKLVFGGGLSASFGTYTNIGISPIIGYRITEDFTAGIGLGYQYVRIRDALQNPQGGFQDYKINIFTPSVWARYSFLENFFAQAEYENNFISYNDLAFDANRNIVTVTKSLSVPAVLVGGGLRQRITDRSSILLTVLFNVYKSDFQIYPDGPIFRVGFNVGY